MLMVAVLALMRWISGSSAICVNLPLAASNSAWYLTLDWFLEFSARRFISGVSATIVAFALGTCLRARRRVYGALELKRLCICNTYAPQYCSLSNPL